MSGLQSLSDDELELALDRSIATRSERTRIKQQLKNAEVGPTSVLLRIKTNPVIGGLKVRDFLRALPGVGSSRADVIMDRLGIAPNRRLRGLGKNQLKALTIEFDW